MKKTLITLLTLFIVVNSSIAQEMDKAKLATAKKTLELVKAKEYKKILKLFPTEIANNIPEETLKYYVDMGAKFIEEDGIPTDSDLTIKANFMNTKDGMVTVTSITFPFPTPKQEYTMPKKIIEIGFMEKYGDSKIVNLNVRELTPMIMPVSTNTEFLDTLNFGLDSLTTWRIYYTKGNIENENREVFAVSGNKDKINQLDLTKDFEDLFKTLKKSEITEKKALNDIVRYAGKPETISLRFQFKGDNKFYRLSAILTSEENSSEPLNDYLIFSTSVFANQQSIYKIKKSDAPKLVELLKKWSRNDWGNNYEARP